MVIACGLEHADELEDDSEYVDDDEVEELVEVVVGARLFFSFVDFFDDFRDRCFRR